jgi:pyruvate kinase
MKESDIHNSSRTKIIATIGPASASPKVLKEIIKAGIDVCRMNFSHGTHQQHLEVINNVRKINSEWKTDIALLADLQGPKIRLGEVEGEGVEVKKDETIVLTNQNCTGNREKIHLSYKNLAKDMKKGDQVLIDDGTIKAFVESVDNEQELTIRFLQGGVIKSRKGVNLPDSKLTVPSLTEKDLDDIKFIMEQDVDWIALSFVRSRNDILSLKEIIKSANKNIRIIAKIEKPEALRDLDSIIKYSDGIMIARGDLGVEIPFERVPYIQKQIVNKCIYHAKPVIVATQMLESMIVHFRPTRAEASDVANGVFDGADTLMLSGETSVGQFPVEAISSMQGIIDYAEGTEFVLDHEFLPEKDSPNYLSDSICYNASKMADQSGATAIVAFTSDGKIPIRISSHRPRAVILAFTPDEKVIRQLSLVWGVRAFKISDNFDINEAVDYVNAFLLDQNIVKKGDTVVYVGSLKLKDTDNAGLLKLSYV